MNTVFLLTFPSTGFWVFLCVMAFALGYLASQLFRKPK
ncbi:MAG: hypothetical protein JWQ27_1247 [Ferruginibacter sp.]|nr:hypothetical protein [Ferruginibacter sp.]